MPPRVTFEGAKFCFMSHNFRSRCARKSIKGSIDADFDLVSTKLWVQKMAHWDGAQDQEKMTKITQKHPYLWRSPKKSSNPKRKNLFFDFDYKSCWIRRGFEQLSSSIAWRVIGLQSSARKVAHAGLKGSLVFPKRLRNQVRHNSFSSDVLFDQLLDDLLKLRVFVTSWWHTCWLVAQFCHWSFSVSWSRCKCRL